MKIIGALLIVICGVLIGSELRERLRSRVRILGEYESVCLRMISMIRFQHTPLDRLIVKLKDSDSDVISMCGLYVDEGDDFREAWEKAVASSGEIQLLRDEEKKLIKELGEYIGRSDSDGEITMLGGMKEEFGKAAKRAQKELSEKRRVYSVCGVLGGIMCALMVI